MTEKEETKTTGKEENPVANIENELLRPLSTSSLNKTQIIEALATIGVEASIESTKKELEELYYANAEAIAMQQRMPQFKEACLIKSFGDHGRSPICKKKCRMKQKNIFEACARFKEMQAEKKVVAASKKSRRMGHRTGSSLWGTKINTMANTFCKALYEAGDNGLTLAEARNAKWNPKKYGFKETATRLVREGIAELKNGRYTPTKKGMEIAKEELKAA